jgi:hypothetical protein
MPALEAQPDREDVAEQRPESGDAAVFESVGYVPVSEAVGAPEPEGDVVDDEHRDGALEGIKEERGGGEPLAAGTQHVGRADVAGADIAYVAQSGRLRQHQAERDRAEQIPEQQCEKAVEREKLAHGQRAWNAPPICGARGRAPVNCARRQSIRIQGRRQPW